MQQKRMASTLKVLLNELKRCEMKKFVFLTRVSRIQNVQKIKDHLKEVFKNAIDVDYQHILLADLTVGNKIEDFDQFKD